MLPAPAPQNSRQPARTCRIHAWRQRRASVREAASPPSLGLSETGRPDSRARSPPALFVATGASTAQLPTVWPMLLALVFPSVRKSRSRKAIKPPGACQRVNVAVGRPLHIRKDEGCAGLTHRCGKCHQETQHGLQGLTACFHEGVALKSLPPEECGIRKGNVYPVLDILREPIEHNVTVGKQHVLSPLTSVIMPPGRRIPEIVTVVFPFPITLDDLVDRAAGDFGGFDGFRCARVSRIAISGHMSRPPGIHVVLGNVAVAIFYKTVYRAIIGITMIRGTAPCSDSWHVPVQWAIGRVHGDAEGNVQPTGYRRGCAPLSSGCAPATNGGIDIPVILHIHNPAQPNLMLVAGTLSSFSLLLGLRQSWQQQRCEDGDDSNDHQQ